MEYTTWTNNPGLFGLEVAEGTQLDGFDQSVEVEWDDVNEVFWLTFENEAAFRLHQA